MTHDWGSTARESRWPHCSLLFSFYIGRLRRRPACGWDSLWHDFSCVLYSRAGQPCLQQRESQRIYAGDWGRVVWLFIMESSGPSYLRGLSLGFGPCLGPHENHDVGDLPPPCLASEEIEWTKFKEKNLP